MTSMEERQHPEKDNHGRLIVLDPKVNGANLVLMNLYVPNDIFHRYSLIGGDFNCPLTELYKIGWKPAENKKRVRDKISQLSDLYTLCKKFGVN